MTEVIKNECWVQDKHMFTDGQNVRQKILKKITAKLELADWRYFDNTETNFGNKIHKYTWSLVKNKKQKWLILKDWIDNSMEPENDTEKSWEKLRYELYLEQCAHAEYPTIHTDMNRIWR